MRVASLYLMISLLMAVIPAYALPPPERQIQFQNSVQQIFDTSAYIDGNSVLMFVTNKGSFAYDLGAIFGKVDGFYFPYLSVDEILDGSQDKTVVYSAGIYMAGIDSASGDTLVSAADYGQQFFPGPMENGTFIAGAETMPQYRVYKIHRDSLASNPNLDFQEWPISDGAPSDNLGNPRLFGDQTLWSVYNDANPSFHTYFVGTTVGMGVEIRHTLWAHSDFENYSIFSKYELINKSANLYEDFFISLWFDPDLGSAGDDAIGCDTLNDIFYVYNFGPDAVYGSAPPAFGGKLIEGPIVPATGSTAFVDGLPVLNYKNTEMHSFMSFYASEDPDNPSAVYQSMNGLLGYTGGTPLPNGTRYMVPGDPVAGTGELDIPNGYDRRMFASFGPFDFRPNDTQQIIVKLAVGQGSNPLNSITELKQILNSPYSLPNCCIGMRGDINGDGTDNTILDLNYMVNDIFRGGANSPCGVEADVNSNGTPSTIQDLNFLVNKIFRGGPSPGPCESK